MKRLSLLCLVPALACAQDMIGQGADVFGKSCATGYCHAAKGGSGSPAPRLAARGFSEDYISQTIRRGIPSTAMPAFGDVLPRQELAAVIAYVDSLNGVTPRNPAPEAEPEKKVPPEAARGRELFFDSLRGFGRCSTCHQVDGFGVPAASPIAKIPADAAALRQLATPHVETATVGGESFPALVVSQGKNQTKLYDLTAPPPVLRTLAPASVALKKTSDWQHASVLSAYNDAELQAILAYVRAAVAP
ncbi:MAG TPA: c-type cytochrome [Candidatus Sulfopaludibacter sp.]|nr:c-type cytochrome [Candidatus Sulfopaludibacter sp.]